MRMIFAFALCATQSVADPVEITDITATPNGDSWRFDVTLRHPDTGWDHYADAWQVEDADGTVLGQRILAHPHVNEQPFTRSQSGIVIPAELTTVYLRARCLVDGWNAETTAYNLGR